jgi:hypothetical protein
MGPARAAAIAAAFELGRRGAWSPPQRGERILDPASRLLQDHRQQRRHVTLPSYFLGGRFWTSQPWVSPSSQARLK